jgi:LytS/YehU family sensor histidine kinase
MSGALYLVFTYRPAWIATGRRIVLSYVVLLLILLPLQVVHLLKPALGEPGMSWQAIELGISRIDQFASMLRFSTTTAVYFCVIGLKAWQLGKARQRDAERATADSQALRFELAQQRALALRAQLEPHFLFNALGAISALVRAKESEIALDGIHDLGELLRHALEASDKEWTSIADELAFVEQYLSLQRLRYGTRLQVRVEGLDAQLLSGDMPPLLLQPLVENAIKYAVTPKEEGADISVTAQLVGQRVRITVSDTGPGLQPGQQDHSLSTGVGMANTRERLSQAYGDDQRFEFYVKASGGFEVLLELPYQTRIIPVEENQAGATLQGMKTA